MKYIFTRVGNSGKMGSTQKSAEMRKVADWRRLSLGSDVCTRASIHCSPNLDRGKDQVQADPVAEFCYTHHADAGVHTKSS